MALTSALFSGVSGINANGNAMNIIGDNIANVNTIGFKASRSVFFDLLSAEVGGTKIGTGSRLAAATHFPAKAKHVIFLFLNGGPSQVDTFDPKPLLSKHHGQPMPTPNLKTERKTGSLLRSPFQFKKCGQSGIEISEIFPKLGSRSTTSA